MAVSKGQLIYTHFINISLLHQPQVETFSAECPRMSTLGGTTPVVYHDDVERKMATTELKVRADYSSGGAATSSVGSGDAGTTSGIRGSSRSLYANDAMV